VVVLSRHGGCTAPVPLCGDAPACMSWRSESRSTVGRRRRRGNDFIPGAVARTYLRRRGILLSSTALRAPARKGRRASALSSVSRNRHQQSGGVAGGLWRQPSINGWPLLFACPALCHHGDKPVGYLSTPKGGREQWFACSARPEKPGLLVAADARASFFSISASSSRLSSMGRADFWRGRSMVYRLVPLSATLFTILTTYATSTPPQRPPYCDATARDDYAK